MLLRFDGFEKTYNESIWDYVDAFKSAFILQDGPGAGYRSSVEFPHYAYEIMNTGFSIGPLLMYDMTGAGSIVKIAFYWRARPALGDSEFFCLVSGSSGTYRKAFSLAIRNGSIPSGPKAGAYGQLQVWSTTDAQPTSGALENFHGSKIAYTTGNVIDPLQWYLVQIVYTKGSKTFEVYLDGDLVMTGTCLGPADVKYAALRWESFGSNRTCFDDLYVVDNDGAGQISDFVTAAHITYSSPISDAVAEWETYGVSGSPPLYTVVNDRGSGGFDGMQTGTSGRRALFTMQNAPIGTPVYGVLFKLQLVQKEEGGTTTAIVFGRINGVDYDIVSFDVPYDVRQTYPSLGGYYIPTFVSWKNNDPRGGPWQYEDFVGGWRFGVRHGGGATLRCTAFSVERFHESAEGGSGSRYISF